MKSKNLLHYVTFAFYTTSSKKYKERRSGSVIITRKTVATQLALLTLSSSCDHRVLFIPLTFLTSSLCHSNYPKVKSIRTTSNAMQTSLTLYWKSVITDSVLQGELLNNRLTLIHCSIQTSNVNPSNSLALSCKNGSLVRTKSVLCFIGDRSSLAAVNCSLGCLFICSPAADLSKLYYR
jgi:hypothetical protein